MLTRALLLFRTATMKKHIAAISAEQGSVSNQDQTTLLATPQRTAERRRVAPTPMIAPVIVCVVLTGIPQRTGPRKEQETEPAPEPKAMK